MIAQLLHGRRVETKVSVKKWNVATTIPTYHNEWKKAALALEIVFVSSAVQIDSYSNSLAL